MEDIVNHDEKSPLLKDKDGAANSLSNVVYTSSGRHDEFKVYKKRWYMLAVFCYIAFVQGLLWNTWTPMGDTMLIGFQWPASFLAFSLAVSNISIVVAAFPLMYLIETRGLRLGAVIAASSLVFGAVTWNILFPTGQLWLLVIASICIGMPNCVSLAGAPLLSVLWFPVNERTTATAFTTMNTFLGVAFSFIVGPLISNGKITQNDVNNIANMTVDDVDKIQNGVFNVVYFETGLAALCFILVMVYFPAKPPCPPSRAQTKEREDYWLGLKHLLRNYDFWILNLAFNVANGTFNAWLPLMSVNFTSSLGMDQVAAGFIGFTSIVCGGLGSLGIAAIVDRDKRHTKRVMIVLLTTAVCLFAILSCIQMKYIHVSEGALTAVVYILSIAVSTCMIGGVPLYYELGCEIAYPVYEGLASTLITVTNDVFGLLFYALFLIPSLAESSVWMTWACLGACVCSFPLLILLKEHYYRLNVEVEDE